MGGKDNRLGHCHTRRRAPCDLKGGRTAVGLVCGDALGQGRNLINKVESGRIKFDGKAA